MGIARVFQTPIEELFENSEEA